jgi:hypothetical protein
MGKVNLHEHDAPFFICDQNSTTFFDLGYSVCTNYDMFSIELDYDLDPPYDGFTPRGDVLLEDKSGTRTLNGADLRGLMEMDEFANFKPKYYHVRTVG